MAKDKVSIILPTYNRAHMLKKSLGSLLAQSYPWFEILLVDDGSTDNTRELVESYGDKRIRYYYAGRNQGAAAARNFGLERAEGEYIAFQDSDDVWHKDKLKKQMDAIRRADESVGVVYHKIAYDFGAGRYAILPSEQIAEERKSGMIYAQMLYDNLIPCPSMLVRRSAVVETGKFDTDLKALEDYDFALKLTKKYKTYFINEVLLEASYSNQGVSGNPANYLTASCMLLAKYKRDYLQTDTFNHRVEVILCDAEKIGMKEQFVQLLEKLLRSEG